MAVRTAAATVGNDQGGVRGAERGAFGRFGAFVRRRVSGHHRRLARRAFRSAGLTALFDDNPDAICAFDVDGRFVAGNRALAQRTGYPEAALLDMDFTPTVHPDEVDRVQKEFRAVLGGEVRRYRTRGIRPDGTIFFVDVINIPIRRRERIVGVLGIARDIDELERSHEAWLRSESLVRMANRLSRFGSVRIDFRDGKQQWSDEVFNLLGFPIGDGEPTIREALSRFAPASARRLKAAIERCAADGTPIAMRVQIRQRNGRVMHARVVGEAIRDDPGEVIGLSGGFTDVTREVDASRVRRRLEARIAATLGAISDAVFFVDEDGRLEYLNAKAEGMFRRPASELLGHELAPRLAESGNEGLVAAFREAEQERHTIVYRGYHAESEMWTETTIYPTGRGMAVHVRDVSDVEHARRQMDDDARRLASQSALLDSTTDAIIVRGLGDRVEYWNRRAAELFGVSPVDAKDRFLRELLDADPAEYADAVARLADDGHWHGELTARDAKGERRILDCRWELIRDAAANPESVFCVLTDITERKRQEELLLRTQRMESIGTLAGGIAHDLNNVLTPLLLATQVLSDDETDPARRAMLESMEATIHRGAGMIRQVLAFARGVDGERSRIDLTSLVGEFAAFCRDTLPKNVEVVLDIEPGLAVVGDRNQLLQVLVNLATNARDAMPSGGRITVTARSGDGRVSLVVADEGTGMPPEVAERIFEPFYTTKGVGHGTGLGLAISQAILRSHRGSIDVATAPGEGTRFSLDLPAASGEAPADSDAPADRRVELGGLAVLVVDDEAGIRDMIHLVLEGAGASVDAAASAEDGRDFANRRDYDLIITGLAMPGDPGDAFVAWLDRRNTRQPVVVVTELPDREITSGNVRAVVAKPFSRSDLLQAAAAAVGGKAR